MKRLLAVVLSAVAVLLPSLPALGASITFDPVKDNTIYAENDSLSNALGVRVFAGDNGVGDRRRGLVKFDLTGLSSGAIIDSVVLRLTMVQSQPGSRVVKLHRLLADWGEGTSVGGFGEGQGGPATAGDATWTQRFFGSAQPWTTAGGDFSPTTSASRPVGGLGPYTWRSAGMNADVSFWRANPSQNYGWEIIGVETGPGTAKAFGSLQAVAAGDRPLLTVYYTLPTPAGPLPAATRLFPVQPNPFNPSAMIRYELARGARVTLEVYDAGGRLVRVLVENDMPAGLHQVTWQGDDARRQRVASGVYFARLRVEGEPARVEKMVLVK